MIKKLILMAVILAVLAAQWLGIVQFIDYQLTDRAYQQGRLLNPDIYVVGIDEVTLTEYGEWQQWNREKTADFIALLNQDPELAPAVIGIDIGFYGEKNPYEDEKLIKAAGLADNLVLTSYLTFGKEIVEEAEGFSARQIVKTYERPYDGLRELVSSGHSNISVDSDGIVRRALHRLPAEDETVYSFAVEIYRKYMGTLPEQTESYIPFAGKPYDFYGSRSSGLSLSRVLSGEIPAELFAGSIVLLGPYSTGMMDTYYTSVSRTVPMYGVEIHANIVQGLLDGAMKQEPGPVAGLLVTLAVLVLFSGFLFLRDVRKTAAAGAAVGIGYWAAAAAIYERGWVLSLFYPLAGIIVLVMCHIAYRYVTEQAEKKHLVNIFGKYVPKQVVDNIVKCGEAALNLGGQKKDIAVLFVDIRGFTTLAEALPAEQVVELLNRYLELTTQAVFQTGGTIDKFIGDATMACYNMPLDLDDYEFRAVKSALAMAAGAEVLAEELELIAGKNFGFGIGIHCGEAVVGNIGTGRRMEYTAIGDTVNIAARLESQAAAGQIVISEAVYQRLQGRIIAECIGSRALKGKSGEMMLYRVTGIIE